MSGKADPMSDLRETEQQLLNNQDLEELKEYDEYFNRVFAAVTAAMREADRMFQADGATGTRNYLRDYFFPTLERHGLRFTIPTVTT